MAARFWVGGNANWDNTAGLKWSLLSGGVGGQAVPTASDAVHLDNGLGTGNVTITIAAVCASIDCTAYIGTLNISTGTSLTVSGNVTLATGMTSAGDGGGVLTGAATGTWTSHGQNVPWSISYVGTSQTYTLADAWAATGSLNFNGTTNTTLNGNSMTIGNNLNPQAAVTVFGTTIVVMTGASGTAKWRNTGNGTLRLPVTFNGNVTIDTANTIIHGSGQIKYTSGTITTTGSTLQTIASTVSSWDTNGVTWHNVTIVGGSIVTLGSDFACDGTMLHSTGVGAFSGAHNISCGAWTISGGAGIVMTISGNVDVTGLLTLSCSGTNSFSGSFTITADSATVSNQIWNLSGALHVTNLLTTTGPATFNNQSLRVGGMTLNSALIGTTPIEWVGGNSTANSTWSGSAACSCSVNINGGANTLTMSGTILYAASGTPTLTYTSGTIDATGSTLSIATACTLVGGTYNNLTFTAALVVTINTTPVVLLGTLTLPNATVTFAGTAGLTAGTWTNAALTGTRVYVLTTGNTYQVTNSFAPTQDGTNKVSMQSSSASVPVVFTVVPGARQSVMNVISTLIDSSQGQAVYDQLGTLSQDLNWYTQYPWPGFFTF